MLCIGVDPGWAKFAVGAVEGDFDTGFRRAASQTIRIVRKHNYQLEERIAAYEEAIKKFMVQVGMPDKFVLEMPDICGNRIWVKTTPVNHLKLGLAAGLLWGILKGICLRNNIPLMLVNRSDRRTYLYAPTKEKAQALCQQRGWDYKTEDEADALVLALRGFQIEGD